LSLASGSNLSGSLASVPIGGGGTLLAPDANFSWTGATNTTWSTSTNWSPAGPPTGADTALFNGAFTNQPNITVATSVGTLWMTDPVAQNVTLSGAALTINGTGIPGTGILVDNTNAFTLTISAGLVVGGDQAWTNNNNSSNFSLTVSGTVNLNANDLTVNGTGNTTISGVISGGAGSSFTKDGSGTLVVTGNNTYTGTTTVNGGTLLVNGSGDLGVGNVIVNGSGSTLGGNTNATIANGFRVTVNAGAILSPGNGVNGTANITIDALTLQPGANFRVDLNGTTVGTQYDRINMGGGGAANFVFAGSNLVVHVGFAVVAGQTFTIAHQGGGFGAQQFAQGTQVVADTGRVFTITYTGDNIILTATDTIVPEPGTWFGGALAFAALGFTQRRRIARGLSRSRLLFRRLPSAT
jgi:autotransporter-associated beta strand protein